MEDTTSNLITTGIDLMIVSLILGMIVSLLSIISTYSASLSAEEAEAEILREYREYNQYDSKIVYAQDVISAILRYRGEPIVSVKDGMTKTWSLVSTPCDYTTAALVGQFDQTKQYNAVLVRDASNQVIRIEFTAR